MIVGLTGGIGSGKSAVAHGLREMGYTVLDTDSIARRLMETDKSVKEQVSEVFGLLVYNTDGTLNRPYLARTVFTHPDLLERLNAIVHPAVFDYIKNLFPGPSPKERGGTSPVTFVESAILFESGLNELCDKVITISAPEQVRLRRAMLRDLASEEKIRARMNSQWSDEQREQRSDLVIINGENAKISDLCLQIQKFLCNFAG